MPLYTDEKEGQPGTNVEFLIVDLPRFGGTYSLSRFQSLCANLKSRAPRLLRIPVHGGLNPPQTLLGLFQTIQPSLTQALQPAAI